MPIKPILLTLSILMVQNVIAGTQEQMSLKSTPASSLEVNMLWPFLPGGINEFRYINPVFYNNSSWHGALVLGLYSDFASNIVRDSSYGKVTYYAGKFGYRQHFMRDWQLELAVNLGWRQERDRPNTNEKLIEGVAARAWTMFGYQYNLTEIFYVNARAGIGLHLYRSDNYANTEKMVVFGLDINLGVSF